MKTDPIRKTWSPSQFETGFIFLVLIGYACTISWGTFHHEMWRDEIQAWVLARDTPTPWAFAQTIKYEGHPCLWHMGLWILSRITPHPGIMQIYHILIATTSAWLLLRHSPFTRMERVMLLFGYYLVYEYAVLARNYALGVLLLFLFAWIYPQRFRHPLRVAFVLFLAAQTSVHALFIVFSATLSMLFEYSMCPSLRSSAKCAQAGRLGMATGLVMAGMVLSTLQLLPPSDSNLSPSWNFFWNPTYLKRVLFLLPEAYGYMPQSSDQFWIQDSRLMTIPLLYRHPIFWSGLLTTACTLFLFRRPFILLYWFLSTSSLLLFFYVKFFGGTRHHGFLYICLLTSLWMLLKEDSDSSRSRSLFRLLFLGMLALQVFSGTRALRLERDHVFSGAKATASFMKEHALTELPIVTWDLVSPTSVLGYSMMDRFFFVRRNDYGSYVVWDSNWDHPVGPEELMKAVHKIQSETKTAVLLLGSSPLSYAQMLSWSHQIQPLFTSPQRTICDESFFLYLVALDPTIQSFAGQAEEITPHTAKSSRGTQVDLDREQPDES